MLNSQSTEIASKKLLRSSNRWKRVWLALKRDRYLHLLVLPAVVSVFIFSYVPMYGIQIAFKEYSFSRGIWDSPWVGFENFYSFFESIYFWRLIRNTVLLSFLSLVFSFPVPIIFSLLLNEVRNQPFKNTIQTISYFPHFISIVIVAGMMHTLLSPETGTINQLIELLGGKPIAFMQSSAWFRPLYIISGIWQGFGWNSIIYLSALTGVSPELYEAAEIDGAGRFRKIWSISLPAIIPTVVIMLILAIGGLMNVGYEKIILMYNPGIYEVSDVISTYVYRKSIQGGEFSFGTAVGLFNNVVNFIIIFIANKISRTVSEISLW